MKHTKWVPQISYAEEVNKLAENHTEAILALYCNAFNDGMRVGKRNAFVGVLTGTVVGVISLCIIGGHYLERKE